MAERRDDPNAPWKYDLLFPGADYKVNRAGVAPPQLVEATGVDGRFLGAVRPFPGMADVTVHGVPKPETGVTTIESIANILGAWYVSIQRGTAGHTLKGLVYLADNQGGTGPALYFAYKDSSGGPPASDVVCLEDFDSWDDFKLVGTPDEYDVCSLGRYIYFVASGATESPAGDRVDSFHQMALPYNKAYFWDFKVNDWDTYSAGLQHRFMGLLPLRCLGIPVNEDRTDGKFVQGGSDYAFYAGIYDAGGSHSQAAGAYTYAVEQVSRKHNLRSWMRWYTEDPSYGGSAAVGYRIPGGCRLPEDGGGHTQQIKAPASLSTCLIMWGIPHMDGFRFWRTLVNDTGVKWDKYTLMQPLHLVDEYRELHDRTELEQTYEHDSEPGVVSWDAESTWWVDEGLVGQPTYNPYDHGFFPAPRMKRIATYDNLLVGVTDPEEPATLDVDWSETEQKRESLVWSTLTTQEPENFPPANLYEVDDAGEKFLSLERAGDHLFAVSTGAVYKVTRSGSSLALTKLLFRLGGVSRHGQTGVGNVLFIITKAGMKAIDGNSGSIQSISSMNRIIQDNAEWAQSLESVILEYDATCGALILLNPTLHECFILWESTGAVTRLVDCPWTFLVGGPNVKTDGPQRAYFVDDSGVVSCIDAAREMGKRTMCGTGAGETVNGDVTSASQTHIVDTGATFPVNCVGHKVYITSGDLVGEIATVTARGSATDLTVTGLSDSLTIGDQYSVAPVVTELVMPQLSGPQGLDPFCRKTGNAISVAFSDFGGETGGSDPNAFVTMGFKRNNQVLRSTEVDLSLIPDQCVGRVNAADVRLYPYLKFVGSNIDFQLQSLLVKGILGASETQSA